MLVLVTSGLLTICEKRSITSEYGMPSNWKRMLRAGAAAAGAATGGACANACGPANHSTNPARPARARLPICFRFLIASTFPMAFLVRRSVSGDPLKVISSAMINASRIRALPRTTRSGLPLLPRRVERAGRGGPFAQKQGSVPEKPLSPALSPLLRRREREKTGVVSECAHPCLARKDFPGIRFHCVAIHLARLRQTPSRRPSALPRRENPRLDRQILPGSPAPFHPPNQDFPTQHSIP